MIRSVRRVSVRTLLAMVTVWCLVIAAICWRAKDSEQLAHHLDEMGCGYQWNYELGDRVDFEEYEAVGDIGWIHKYPSLDVFRRIASVSFPEGHAVANHSDVIKRLQAVRRLNLRGTRADDLLMSSIGCCSELETLDLSGTLVTDEGVKCISQLHGLKDLLLDDTQIGDACLGSLADVTTMETLSLNKTSVTDSGVAALKGLPKLRRLYLSGTRVTPAAARRLSKDLPGTLIVFTEKDGWEVGIGG